MLYNQLGIAVLSGVAVIIILTPVNACVGTFLRKYNKEVMTVKDKRIRLMTEILNGIKVIF